MEDRVYGVPLFIYVSGPGRNRHLESHQTINDLEVCGVVNVHDFGEPRKRITEGTSKSEPCLYLLEFEYFYESHIHEIQSLQSNTISQVLGDLKRQVSTRQ